MVRFEDHGGESDDRLAPVIPLFGDRDSTGLIESNRRDGVTADSAGALGGEVSGSTGASETWHSSWIDDVSPEDDRATRDDPEPDPLTARKDGAAKSLLKKLRTKSLSIREARAVIADHDLPAEAVEDVVADFLRRGYLDDAALAEQLIHSGVDRKGQGRQAIGQTLAKRGIPREVADAALQSLPDDDLERALEFARGKARSLRDLNHDVAVRRLTGQLARRGYPGSVAFTAAKTALGEPGRRSGVRFE